MKIFPALSLLAFVPGPLWGLTRHRVEGRESLWVLAQKYYGNPLQWPAIAEANAQTIKDAHWIYPGEVLVIPDIPLADASLGQSSNPAASVWPVVQEASRLVSVGKKEGSEVDAQKTEDLSTDMPPSLSGQYPSALRLKVSSGWKEDGEIMEFEGREIMAAQGDMVTGHLSQSCRVARGDKFSVYRPDAVRELDDPQGRYFQEIGVVELREDLGESLYRFLVLKSGDSVQPGDVLKKED